MPERWRVVVPRLWGWVPIGPTFESRMAAHAWLVQFGDIDGRLLQEAA